MTTSNTVEQEHIFTPEQKKYLLNFLRFALTNLPASDAALKSHLLAAPKLDKKKLNPLCEKTYEDEPGIIGFPKQMECIAKASFLSVGPAGSSGSLPYFTLMLQYSPDVQAPLSEPQQVSERFSFALMELLEEVGREANLEHSFDVEHGKFGFGVGVVREPFADEEAEFPEEPLAISRSLTITLDDRTKVLGALNRLIDKLELELQEPPALGNRLIT